MKYDYFYQKNLYSLEECKLLKEKISRAIDHNIEDIKADGVLKTAEVGSFPIGSLKDDLQKFNQSIIGINRNNFGFDVFETCDFEYLNYNVYKSSNQGEYQCHSDKVLSEPYDIKLTAILNISTEAYEGGDFEIFLNSHSIIPELREPGTLLVFPSFLFHRVTPVTKGERTTISRWVNGPNFK
jgi:PKHD-type hydroxylase